MKFWGSIEIFNGTDAAQIWADTHIDALVESAISQGAIDWNRNKTAWGVVLEVQFETDKSWKDFIESSSFKEIINRVPDPVNGVLIYRGRSIDGGRSARRPRPPRSGAGGAAVDPFEFETIPFDVALAALFSDSTVDRRPLIHSR